MNDLISELHGTIRRLTPHLLIQQQPDFNVIAGENRVSSSNSKSVRDELQLETSKELASAISAFVWNLDQLWDSSMSKEDGKNKTTVEVDYARGGMEAKYTKEPLTEWNDEAKSLIREGYGILYTIASPVKKESCFISSEKRQQEELRRIARTSILELLPLVTTSPCRHFLLELLPHFIPLSMLMSRERSGVDDDWSSPSWLQDADLNSSLAINPLGKMEQLSTDTIAVENTMDQFSETFQSLIQTDPSTLAPFLGMISLLFDNHTHNPEIMDTENSNVATRKKYCHICILSLPSISEHDLPSVIYSLFTLVCDKEDGYMAAQAIRKEWVAITASQSDEDSVLLIGNVIVSFLLTNRTNSAKCIFSGFFDEITQSLRDHFQSHPNYDGETNGRVLTTLDAMIIAALYSQDQYQQKIEALIDSLVSKQSFISLDFVKPFIRIWGSRSIGSKLVSEGSKVDSSHLLLYEELATPLVSLIFYLIVATSMSQRGPRHLNFLQTGGLLPFHDSDATITAPCDTSQALSYSCCKVFGELYSVLDLQWRERVNNSLLSMMSDSFVQSATATQAVTEQSLEAVPNLIAAAYSASFTLSLIADKHYDDVYRIRSALLDRLLLLASRVGDDSTYILFDLNSALLVALMQENQNFSTVGMGGVSELLILCQKLLFTARIASKRLNSDEDEHHRIVCGIILAGRIVRCNNISRVERIDVWKSVIKLLSPPTKTSHSEIGIWGLSFLRFASSDLDYTSIVFAPHAPRFVDTSSICGETDLFNIVNNMLAAAGVIQIENNMKVSSQSEMGKRSVFLAFNHVMMNNLFSRTKDAPRFVVCPSYFLLKTVGDIDYPNGGQMLVNIKFASTYIYDLVDCYLQLGKSSEQWNPRGWLIAKIQLPCLLPSSILNILGMEENDQLELDLVDTPTFTSSRNPNNSFWKSVVVDILQQKKTRAAVVWNLVQFMNAVIISISLSCAVLKHANEHFQLQSSQQVSDEEQQKKMKRRLVALQKLLQYQVAKILRMQNISAGILLVLRGIYAEVYRSTDESFSKSAHEKPNDESHKANPREIRIPVSKLKHSISSANNFFKSKGNRISCLTLWNCILDEDYTDNNHWKALLANVDGRTSKSLNSDARFVIRVRSDILRRLQQQLVCQSDSCDKFRHERNGFLNDIMRGIPRIYSSTMTFSSYINNLDNNCSRDDAKMIFGYVSCYYKLLLAVYSMHTRELLIQLPFSTRIQQKKAKQFHLSDNKGDISALSDIIKACVSIELNDTVNPTPSLDFFVEFLSKKLTAQFDQSRDRSMACEIIDLLSVITIHMDYKKSCAILVDITKKALRSIYDSSNSTLDLPYIFFKIGQALSSTDHEQVSFFRACYSQLHQTANTLLKTKHASTSAFIHHFLCHWSALVLSNRSQFKFLVQSMESLDNTITLSLRTKLKRADNRKSKHDQLPGINESSCTPLFELLLHLVATSISIAQPELKKKTTHNNPNKKEPTPYEEVVNSFASFCKILSIFQGHRLFFPQRVFFSVTKVALRILKLGIYQLQSCVKWRSLQHFSLQFVNGDDPFAASLLQPLVDALARDCIGSIEAFCDSMRRSEWIKGFGYKHSKAIVTLMYKCKGLKELLCDTCKSQNLKIPNFTSSDETPNNIVYDGTLDSDDSTTEKNSSSKRAIFDIDHFVVGNKRHRPGTIANASVFNQLDTTLNVSSTSDNEEAIIDNATCIASEDDSSFGALGDWG